MNSSTRSLRHIPDTTVSASEALPTDRITMTPSTMLRRLAATLLVLVCTLVGVLVPAGTANAAVRLGNGAYGTSSLDCGYRSAKLTVQAGANGIGINGFKYWIYSVDHQTYLLSGSWVPMDSGWNAKTIPLVSTRGRYNVYVEYYAYAGGRWYSGGEWAWARNFVQPTSSQTCIVI